MNQPDFPVKVRLVFFNEGITLPGIGTFNKIEKVTHPHIKMRRICTGLLLEYGDEVAEVTNCNIKVMLYEKILKADY